MPRKGRHTADTPVAGAIVCVTQGSDVRYVVMMNGPGNQGIGGRGRQPNHKQAIKLLDSGAGVRLGDQSAGPYTA